MFRAPQNVWLAQSSAPSFPRRQESSTAAGMNDSPAAKNCLGKSPETDLESLKLEAAVLIRLNHLKIPF